MEESVQASASETFENTKHDRATFSKYRIAEAEKLLKSLNRYQETSQIDMGRNENDSTLITKSQDNIQRHVNVVLKNFGWPEKYEAARMIFTKVNPSEVEVCYIRKFLISGTSFELAFALKDIHDIRELVRKFVDIAPVSFCSVYFSILVAIYLDKCQTRIYLNTCLGNTLVFLLNTFNMMEKEMITWLLSDIVLLESSENSREIMQTLHISTVDFVQGSEKHIRALKLIMDISLQVVAKANSMIEELKMPAER